MESDSSARLLFAGVSLEGWIPDSLHPKRQIRRQQVGQQNPYPQILDNGKQYLAFTPTEDMAVYYMNALGL